MHNDIVLVLDCLKFSCSTLSAKSKLMGLGSDHDEDDDVDNSMW